MLHVEDSVKADPFVDQQRHANREQIINNHTIRRYANSSPEVIQKRIEESPTKSGHRTH